MKRFPSWQAVPCVPGRLARTLCAAALGVWLTYGARAEDPGAQAPAAQGGAGGNGYAPPASQGPAAGRGPRQVGSSIQIWDDGVFNLDPKPAGPAVSPRGRYMDEAPDYTSEQQAEWKRICEPQKAIDQRAYRECYFREKARAQAEVQESFRRTDRGESGMRGMGSPSSLKGSGPRVPAADIPLSPESNRVNNDKEND